MIEEKIKTQSEREEELNQIDPDTEEGNLKLMNIALNESKKGGNISIANMAAGKINSNTCDGFVALCYISENSENPGPIRYAIDNIKKNKKGGVLALKVIKNKIKFKSIKVEVEDYLKVKDNERILIINSCNNAAEKLRV